MRGINLILILVMVCLVLPMTSASLGRFNPGDCVPIVTALNATAVNITTLTSPGPPPVVELVNQPMQANGNAFNYTFCNTNQTGTYTYGYCDNNANCYSNDFQVGDTGFAIILILGIAAMIIFVFGWFQHNIWFVYISGILALVFGVYIIINGFSNLNNVYTQTLGYVSIGFAIMFFVVGAYEQFVDEDGGGDE